MRNFPVRLKHPGSNPQNGFTNLCLRRHCRGRALAVSVILAKTRQLALWENWDSDSPRVESLQQLQHPGFLVFDKASQRLLVSESPVSLRADNEQPRSY